MKNVEINAVYSEELESYLSSLGVLERFKTGEAFCSFCEDKITEKNLYSIFPKNNEVCFCCDKQSCKLELSELGDVCGKR